MHSTKNNILYLVFLFFASQIHAQFAGKYNLRDGGVDVPSSSLFLLDNNQFYLFYFGGYKTGKWKEIEKNTIEIIEEKIKSNPIELYAKGPALTEGFILDVDGLAQAKAHIQFSNDTKEAGELQPVFNDSPNCFENEYIIKKLDAKLNWITITLPENPDVIRYSSKYPYKAISYTYAINKKYSDYFILYKPEVLLPPLQMTMVKNGEDYQLSLTKEFLKREKITTEEFQAIAKGLRALKNEEERNNRGVIIPPTSISNTTILEKSKLKPLFTAKCSDNEPSEADPAKDKKSYTKIDRKDGFYLVTNYKSSGYNEDKFELTQNPSLTKEDVSRVSKEISDYGGYEIRLELSEVGTKKLADLSKANIGNPLAIVINKEIIWAPVISTEIPNGKLNITGNFTETEIDTIISKLTK